MNANQQYRRDQLQRDDVLRAARGQQLLHQAVSQRTQNPAVCRSALMAVRPHELPDIVWCDVPAGKFLYGKNKQEREIKYNFKIAKYPVTFIQFHVFIDSGEYDDVRWWQGMPDKYQHEGMAQQNPLHHDHPRNKVSWYQALAYSRWLNAKYREAGLIGVEVQIRLPLEWEWEYAARGSEGRQYPWGDSYCTGYANVDEQEQGVESYVLRQTRAVGLYPQGASPFGVLDMAGTVWEWCLNDYRTPEPTSISNEREKVLRGGSFLHSPDYATASYRNSSPPGYRLSSFGFRLVVSSPMHL